MAYVKPGDVHAPKQHWQLFHVLFDGGAEDNPKALENTTVSLAIGRWDDHPVLAMRWNGTSDNPIGHPQSRGLPTWFILPDQHVQSILSAFAFSNSKLAFVRDFLELRRVYFWTRCRTRGCDNFGELVLVSYRYEELPERLEELERNELPFYCIICDEAWQPTLDEKIRLAEVMHKGLRLYRQRQRQGQYEPSRPATPQPRDVILARREHDDDPVWLVLDHADKQLGSFTFVDPAWSLCRAEVQRRGGRMLYSHRPGVYEVDPTPSSSDT